MNSHRLESSLTIEAGDLWYVSHGYCPIGEKIYDITGYTGRCEIGGNRKAVVVTNVGNREVISDIYPESVAHDLCYEHFCANDNYFEDPEEFDYDRPYTTDQEDAWYKQKNEQHLGEVVRKYAGTKFTLRPR